MGASEDKDLLSKLTEAGRQELIKHFGSEEAAYKAVRKAHSMHNMPHQGHRERERRRKRMEKDQK